MTRYMGLVRMDEANDTPPTQALMDAMDTFIAKSAANGSFVDGGGLFGTEDAINFVVRKGEMTRVDGPYAEAKEVVGGWALLQFDDKEQAVENMREMAQLHVDHWPEGELVITLREISEGPPPTE
ncbi:YciI family protein [Nocardioides sp. CPCC 206347]|uniref:YciI family protein n=1 Tax=unclassified Nocardioides TaxID=2615069 RepID=UPI00360C780F